MSGAWPNIPSHAFEAPLIVQVPAGTAPGRTTDGNDVLLSLEHRGRERRLSSRILIVMRNVKEPSCAHERCIDTNLQFTTQIRLGANVRTKADDGRTPRPSKHHQGMMLSETLTQEVVRAVVLKVRIPPLPILAAKSDVAFVECVQWRRVRVSRSRQSTQRVTTDGRRGLVCHPSTLAAAAEPAPLSGAAKR